MSIKLNVDTIALRVAEHGWDTPEELTLLVDTIIEADAAEMFLGASHNVDLEDLFEYTAQVSKQVQALAIDIKNKENDYGN